MNPSDLFGAFANSTRLRILNLPQAEKEICVCDLQEVLDVAQPTVSQHLSVLRDAEHVDVRTKGKSKFDSLAQPSTKLHRRGLRCVAGCVGEFDDFTEDRARLAGLEIRLRCS